jgi:hypothetical protein
VVNKKTAKKATSNPTGQVKAEEPPTVPQQPTVTRAKVSSRTMSIEKSDAGVTIFFGNHQPILLQLAVWKKHAKKILEFVASVENEPATAPVESAAPLTEAHHEAAEQCFSA